MAPHSDDQLLAQLEQNPANVNFERLRALCERHFGKPRQSGSHLIFKTPWAGDPRINLQKDGSKAKPYQVRQVLAALKKLKTNP